MILIGCACPRRAPITMIIHNVIVFTVFILFLQGKTRTRLGKGTAEPKISYTPSFNLLYRRKGELRGTQIKVFFFWFLTKLQTDIQCQRNFEIIFFHTYILSQKIQSCIQIEKCRLKPKFTRLKSLWSSP